MNKIFVVSIEPLDNRYTKQWFTHVPEVFATRFPNHEVINITGDLAIYDKPQAGAFFDFNATCAYKASQVAQISELFKNNEVSDGDLFFFADAWNPTVHSLKYMASLARIKIHTAGIWHAGAYDPTDILGFTIEDKEWVKSLELSMYLSYDLNFFGTEQHLVKFVAALNPISLNKRRMVAGYPLEYLNDIQPGVKKENIVVFPHRLNSDKAPEIFDMLEYFTHNVLHRPDIRFIKTQKQGFSKEQYYEFLKLCKVVFSANKHENLGIGTFEAIRSGCIPLVPNKLSYKEMYDSDYKYEVTSDFYDSPERAIPALAKKIVAFVDDHDMITATDKWTTMVNRVQNKFFSADEMLNYIGALIESN